MIFNMLGKNKRIVPSQAASITNCEANIESELLALNNMFKAKGITLLKVIGGAYHLTTQGRFAMDEYKYIEYDENGNKIGTKYILPNNMEMI